MKFIIMGTGGVGGYFGGRLAQAGEEVCLVARGAHLAALQRDGLRVRSIRGDFTVQPVRALADPAGAGLADVALVCVKSWQTPGAARSLLPALGPETVVLSLQNGATAAEEIGAVVGMGRMLGGMCQVLSYISAPGEITHAGIEPRVVFGELDGRRIPRAGALLAAFRGCQGVMAELSDNVQVAIWSKFLFISAISGVGAACRAPAGEMRLVPETRALLEAAMRETAAVARARGVPLPADVVARTLAFIDALPESATASMQRDIMEGRPSELEAQNGAVVRLGREAGVPTPAHSFLYAALKPMELRARAG